MVYKPSKKELQQIENLNKAYHLIKEGFKLIKDNIPKKDGEVEMHTYKMSKNFDKIIKRIHKILEKQYIDNEFIEIINISKVKKKDNRLKKKKDNRLKKKKDNKKKNTIRKKK